jgi:hypothetical protein
MSSITLSHAVLEALGYVSIQRRGYMTMYTPTERFKRICREVERGPMGKLLPFPSTYRGVEE